MSVLEQSDASEQSNHLVKTPRMGCDRARCSYNIAISICGSAVATLKEVTPGTN